MCSVVADLLDERSDLFAKLQDTLTYQHELCMNKGCTFNASIKFFNRLKTSDEEQSEESNWDNVHILRDEGYIWNNFWRNKTQIIYAILFFNFFL